MDHTSPIISLTTKASVDTKPTSVTPYMQLYGSSVSNQASPSIETKRKSITSSLESNVIFDASNQELSSFSTHSISNPTSSSVIDVTRLVPTTAIFTVEANSTCYSSFGYTTVSSLDELNCIALYTNTISNTSRGSSAIKDISHTKISGIVNDGKALTPLTAIDTFFNGDWYSICPDKSIFGCIKVLVNTALQDIKQLYKHSICITGYSLKESLMANSFLSSSSSSTLYQQFLGSFCQFGARDSRIVQKQHVAAAQFMVPGSNATHNILNDCTKSEPTAATISRNYTESSASTTTSNVERTSNTLLPASSNTHTSSTTSTSDNSTTNTSLKSRSQPPKTNRMLTASKEYRARKSARKIQIITLSSTPLPTATYTFSKNATSATMTWSRIPSLTLNQQYTTSNININKTTNTISISADDTATSTKSATRPRKRSRVPTASREYRARRFSRRERLNRFTSPNTENIIPSTKRRELHRIKAINPPSNWNSVKRYQQQKEPDYLTDDQKFMFEIQPIFLDGVNHFVYCIQMFV